MTEHHRPIWDRGEAIDPEMLSYTIGDDWLQDQRLVEHDIAGSLAHVAGLVHAGLLEDEAGQRISKGLRELLDEYRAGSWQLTPADEDDHIKGGPTEPLPLPLLLVCRAAVLFVCFRRCTRG